MQAIFPKLTKSPAVCLFRRIAEFHPVVILLTTAIRLTDQPIT